MTKPLRQSARDAKRRVVKNFEAASVSLFTALVLSTGAAPTRAQMQAPVNAPRSQAADTARMMEAFDRADANRDGRLSKTESEHLPAVAQRFEQIDADRDGSISKKEFEDAVK
jgi:Ca2+-binding EF-hand superfamily protein